MSLTVKHNFVPLNSVFTINDNATVESKMSLEGYYDEIFQAMIERFNVVPTFEHKCHNCGGTLVMNEDQHIFNCPYCDSVYAIGTKHINSQC